MPLSTRPTTDRTAASERPAMRSVPYHPSITPITSSSMDPILNRKPVCACGGGCPKCLENLGIQAKLTIGAPNDEYEQEADRVADQVMRMPEPQVQRRPDEEEKEEIQTKPLAGQITSLTQRQEIPDEEEDEELAQTKSAGGKTPEISSGIGLGMQSLQGSGQPLSGPVRSFFEPRFGADFGNVRVHNDARAASVARSVNARAFTLGRDVVFGAMEYSPDSYSGRKLLAHELTHVLQQSRSGTKIQRAETDDNPSFCFPPGGTPLQDSASHINAWIRGARTRSTRDGIHMVNAVYQELASGGSVSEVEKRLGALPATHAKHVDYDSSRYAGTLMWPVDPLTRSALWAAGKIFVAPVINLCGTCVGTDKVGHFFQQGYEYYRLYRLIEARLQALPEDEQRAFYRRIAGPPIDLGLPLGIETDAEPFGLGRFEVTPAAIVELAATAFVGQYGLWLEGFNHTLNAEDIRWIRRQSFIPFYYSEGVYGAGSTGVLSRADLQANRMGFHFYQDLWHNPDSTPNICDYVGGLWNEYAEINTVVPSLGTPRGPVSSSLDVETP